MGRPPPTASLGSGQYLTSGIAATSRRRRTPQSSTARPNRRATRLVPATWVVYHLPPIRVTTSSSSGARPPVNNKLFNSTEFAQVTRDTAIGASFGAAVGPPPLAWRATPSVESRQ